ncbi:hypothetical protein M595_1756 [Lyngbya aestuarii BL J]|uniref:Uncharacterized protein n=1 Tax=Lyngbya aestuarii BL J TaxID=1348334 RepID=U7QLW8_9CYAN|nr:hypothetical protein M595_1756 [Lyngbya aestuarii BL J]
MFALLTQQLIINSLLTVELNPQVAILSEEIDPKSLISLFPLKTYYC